MLRAAEAIRKYSKNSGSCRIHSHRVLFFSLILPTAYKTKHFVVLKRDSFKDILQELMEAELDASLGYEKNQKGDVPTSNKRNGHSPKTVKSQYGNSRSMSRETGNGNSSQSSSPNTRGTSPVLKKKCSPPMQGV